MKDLLNDLEKATIERIKAHAIKGLCHNPNSISTTDANDKLWLISLIYKIERRIAKKETGE